MNWDVTVHYNKHSGVAQLSIPAAISRSMRDRDINRAELVLTEQGILLKPYKGQPANERGTTVDLPFAS